MVSLLTKEHFEAIRVQMEREEEGKVTLKSIPDLTDVPVYQLSVTMSKHFHNFETYLSQRYGVEGFPPTMWCGQRLQPRTGALVFSGNNVVPVKGN